MHGKDGCLGLGEIDEQPELICLSANSEMSNRVAARRRHAALRFEPLESRAVLSTVVPTTTVDDLIVNAIITGETVEVARGSGGGGAGKVAMQDFSFFTSVSASSRHPGGVNVAFGDGSVRSVRDSVTTAVWATDAANDGTRQAPTGTGDSASFDDNGHGTHVAGTIGVASSAAGGGGPATGLVTTFQGDRLDPSFDGSDNTNGSTNVAAPVIDTGIDYSYPDLYKNVWINQDELDSILDDLARDISSQDASSQDQPHYKSGSIGSFKISPD